MKESKEFHNGMFAAMDDACYFIESELMQPNPKIKSVYEKLRMREDTAYRMREIYYTAYWRDNDVDCKDDFEWYNGYVTTIRTIVDDLHSMLVFRNEPDNLFRSIYYGNYTNLLNFTRYIY